MKQKHKTKHFLTFGVYIFILLFAGNLVAAYVMHFYVLGASCMTIAQVSSDNRCLYIASGKVYEKATRAAPHQAHPCGTDVTAILPADHLNNPAAYLLPNYIANICAAATPTPIPTSTPKPTATVTPKPTSTPTLTPTHAAAATATPLPPTTKPVATFTPTLTIKPTQTPIPVVHATPTPTIKSVLTLTATQATSIKPTVTPTKPALTPTPTTQPISPTLTIAVPTPTLTLSPTNPSLNLALALVGIDSSTASPLHTEKPVTILVYNTTDTVSSSSAQPLQTIQGTVSFDPPSASFVNPTLSLTNLAAGQYQIFVQIPGYIKKQLIANNNPVLTLAVGTATQIPVTKLLGGDVDGNNIIDVADYNGLLRCYGLHIANPSPACANPQAADLNDDGVIDSSDYNIFLYNLYAYRQQNNLLVSPTLVPTATPTLTPTKVPVATATATPTLQNTPAPVATTPIAATPTSSPKKTSIFAGISDNSGIITRVFDIIVFLIVLATVILGILKSSLFSKKKKPTPSSTKPPTVVLPIADSEKPGVVK